jgi:peptidoglycan/LPS O-acetylase OafA/YrhL
MNRQFVALSGVAMMLIVLNHSIQLGLEYTAASNIAMPAAWVLVILQIFQAFGNFAVPVFLFISGAFIAYAARGEPPRLSWKFLRSGLTHILVPYLIWSLVFYIILFTNRGTVFGPLDYIRNLLVGYPYHFIPLLVFFYLTSPLVVRLGARYAWWFIAVIAVYQLFLINIKYPGALGFIYPDWANYLRIPVLWSTMADWLVCFPLGMVISMNAQSIKPWLQRYKWVFTGLTLVLLVVALLEAHDIGSAFITRLIAPIVFLLVIPVIPRSSIPGVQFLERVGKRSYGLYLTHLIVLDTILLLLSLSVPAVFRLSILLYPIIFAIGLLIPLWVINAFSRSPIRKHYKFVFG